MARKSGRRIVDLVEKDIKPSDIVTCEAVLNSIRVAQAIGGSTNTCLHIPAVAGELDIEVPLTVFNDTAKEIPVLCDVQPTGKHFVADIYRAGGVPAIMKRLETKLGLDEMTVTGKTVGENISNAIILNDRLIRPLDDPIYDEGALVILYGNLAPEGAVIKQSAILAENMKVFTGEAEVFESEQEALNAILSGQVARGKVIVIRYMGPKGDPGMREVTSIAKALVLLGMGDAVSLVTDGRFSGYAHGPAIGHVSPEAFEGGPIAVVRNGDIIYINVPERVLELKVPEEEIQRRLKAWKPPEERFKRGYLCHYVRNSQPTHKGAQIR